MIKRVVLFKKKSEASQNDFVEALKDLETLNSHVTEMASWYVSVNPGNQGLWDAVLIADFEDSEKLSTYNNHPKHVEVGAAIAGFSDFAVFDSTDS